MNPLEAQRNLIIDGFKSGNALVWNRQGEGKFEVRPKKEARKLGEGYEVTLDKVSGHVQDFFVDHPNLRTPEVLNTIRGRAVPYQGWWAWLCAFFCFSLGALHRTLTNFDFLTRSICAGPLMPVPEDGIKMGIANLGSSCWFNSALKFLASTSIYDAGFNQNETSEAAAFRVAINQLRMGEAKELDLGILQNLKTIVEAIPYGYGDEKFSFTRQCDSEEFIRVFMDKIWPAAGESRDTLEKVKEKKTDHFFAESTLEYLPLGDHEGKKAPASDQFMGCTTLHFGEDDLLTRDPVELSELHSRVENFDDPNDLIRDDQDVGHPFSRGLKFTYLPPTLVVNLQRGVRSGTNLEGRDVKCRRPLALEAGSQVTFPLYRVQDNQLIKEKDVTYRIDAAITQQGGMRGGHYVCETRSPNGSLTYHSDQTVRKIDDPIGRHGVFFALTRIDESPVTTDSDESDE